MKFQSGDQLGLYRVHALLGTGAMGEVYLCRGSSVEA